MTRVSAALLIATALCVTSSASAKPTAVSAWVQSECWITKTRRLAVRVVAKFVVIDAICNLDTKECEITETTLNPWNSFTTKGTVTSRGRVHTITTSEDGASYEVSLVTGIVTRAWKALDDAEEKLIIRKVSGRCQVHPDGYVPQ